MTKLDFESYRLQAQNAGDVRDWIFECVKTNAAGVQQYTDTNECELDLKTLGYRNDEQNVTNNWLQGYFTLTLKESSQYNGELPAIPGVRVTHVEKDLVRANIMKVNVQIPTDSWPFIAAALLFTLRNSRSDKEDLIAPYLLKHCFPKLSIETYRNLIENELVPQDAGAFKDWLMQSGGKLKPAPVDIDLPSCGL